MGNKDPDIKGTIFFSENSKRFHNFTNGANYGIHLEGITWPTVTHYMSANEYPDLKHEGIRMLPSARHVMQKIAERSWSRRNKWDVVRDDFLITALRAKFSQHLDLEARLCNTGGAYLVYACQCDSYYGLGPDGNGHNMFGRLLMRIRQEAGRTRCDSPIPYQQLQELAEIEEIARNHPDNPDNLSNLAAAYTCLRMYDRAIAVARRSVILDPDHEWGHYFMAVCLMQLNRHDEAIEPLKQCQRIDPDDSEYCEWLSESYERIGKSIPAILFARRARLIDEGTD